MPARASISTCRRWPTGSAPAPQRWRRFELIRRHVFGAERIHGDDTTVPVLAQGKTITGRLWTYVRDDRPFGGPDPPAAVFYYSRDRGGEHPDRHLAGYAGILQADAYAGFKRALRTGPQARARSPRRRAGAMAAASSSCSPTSPRPLARSPVIAPLALEAVAASMRSSPSSARSTALGGRAYRGAPGAHRAAGRRSGDLDAGPSAPSSRATPTSPRRWTTC